MSKAALASLLVIGVLGTSSVAVGLSHAGAEGNDGGEWPALLAIVLTALAVQRRRKKEAPGARILIAAKESDQCRTMAEALAPRHLCESVQTAAAALERILAPGRWDVIFCDLQLEDARGIDLYKAVRALRRDICGRIIFVSGCAYGDPSEEFLATLANWVLYRPFDADTLRLMVDRRLELGLASGSPES